MNQILKLNGTINHMKNDRGPGAPKLPPNAVLSSDKLECLIASLNRVKQYWGEQKLGIPPLVSVFYKDLVPKSRRISRLLESKIKQPNDSIVGARFSDDPIPKHIITHCVSMECIEDTIKKIKNCKDILDKQFDGQISAEDLDLVTVGKTKLKHEIMSKSLFAGVVKDSYQVERFDTLSDQTPSTIEQPHIVGLFNVGLSYQQLIHKLGFENEVFEKLDDLNWLLTPDQYSHLYSEAPDLISMGLIDLRNYTSFQFKFAPTIENFKIPEPTNEPVIGVIDTQFDVKAYFSDWVNYECMVPSELLVEEDYFHGTEVSSLIVDGPALNPALDDGCGRFRVKHFGVAKHGKYSALRIVKDIQKVVQENRNIKVWNISLGTDSEIKTNSISPEAALLDQLQYENDVIFVISGTNNHSISAPPPRIGSPADSLNSIVVNSMSFSNKYADYSRRGPVLKFFNKPDVCAYGGDAQKGIWVWTPNGKRQNCGTSFATPWITRKLAYLIYVMKLPREVAKALIIDSAAGWTTDQTQRNLVGYGLVPTHIDNILNTPDDEIKFFIYSASMAYDNYAYNIPVPQYHHKYPFIAKATLCYFPRCSKNQGVDYTDTELDIHFGRLNKGKIKSIDNNRQADPGFIVINEITARNGFRKWDNTKHICEGIKDQNKPKKVYEDSNYWGFSIKMKERLSEAPGHGLHFGLVVTLKEISGENRIDEFIRLCSASNWFVHKIDVDNMVHNYEKAEEEIVFK